MKGNFLNMIDNKGKYIKNLNKDYTFSKNGFSVILPNIDNKDINICFVDVEEKRETYCMLDKSTMFYYILEGTGIFEIESDIVKVTKGDLIEIPCKNKYTYSGNLKMLEVQNNPFDENETHEFKRV